MTALVTALFIVHVLLPSCPYTKFGRVCLLCQKMRTYEILCGVRSKTAEDSISSDEICIHIFMADYDILLYNKRKTLVKGR